MGKHFYKRFTMPAEETSVWPSEGQTRVHCFKTQKELKTVFNDITVKHKSARDWRKRFHWDSKLFLWVTFSEASAEEAEKELKTRVKWLNSKKKEHEELLKMFRNEDGTEFDLLTSDFSYQKDT